MAAPSAPAIDPVTLAVPFFILAIVLEILLARLGKVKAVYEAKDTATSLLMGFGSGTIQEMVNDAEAGRPGTATL